MSNPVNDVFNCDWPKPASATPPQNILEKIARFAQDNPTIPWFTIADESQAQALLTALAATYSRYLADNPPANVEAMMQIQRALGEIDDAVRAGHAFDYLSAMLEAEPLTFYGVEICTSRVVLQ